MKFWKIFYPPKDDKLKIRSPTENWWGWKFCWHRYSCSKTHYHISFSVAARFKHCSVVTLEFSFMASELQWRKTLTQKTGISFISNSLFWSLNKFYEFNNYLPSIFSPMVSNGIQYFSFILVGSSKIHTTCLSSAFPFIRQILVVGFWERFLKSQTIIIYPHDGWLSATYKTIEQVMLCITPSDLSRHNVLTRFLSGGRA